MKKALKIVAVVLVVFALGVGIYALASYKHSTPVSNPSVFLTAYATEKTNYEYGEAITFNLMMYVQKEEYIKGGDLQVKLEESPYYEIVDEKTSIKTIEDVKNEKYYLAKNDKYPITVSFTVKVTENTHGVVPIVVKAKFDYDYTYSEFESVGGIPTYYEGKEYFYGFDSLMFIADDFGVWFGENTKDHSLIKSLQYKVDGYVFVQDYSDNWPEIGVDSLQRYKDSGYDTEKLFDKAIEYNAHGGAYLKYSIRDGDQYYMDYFSPTLRARIYIDKDDPLVHQYHANDLNTSEERRENRTDLMKKVLTIIYDSGKITEEQYLAEMELVDAKPGYNHYQGADYQALFMNLKIHYSDETYDVVVDVR